MSPGMATQASVDDWFALSHKIGLTKVTFVTHVLPPIACQYLMGVLVQLDRTRFYRLALLPLIVWFAWRGAFVDMSGGDPKQAQMNTVLVTHMCSISMRCTVWAVARERFRRHSPWKKAGERDSEGVRAACWNAWDLMSSTRGIEWNWPRGLVIPKPAFETDSRTIFVLLSAVQLVFHAFMFDACLQTIRISSPDTYGSIDGGSLFDRALPPHLAVLRAVFVSFLTIYMSYSALEWSYRLLAITFTIVFQQHPSQWPPLFDAPWSSTSLSELWGRRWHQMMRELLVTLGMRPFGYLFGRLGGVFGAFLVSGVFHDIELRSFGGGGDTVAVVGFWVMNGIGVVLERVWKRVTGRSVGGVWGWAWTFGWLTLWGVPVVDAWARAGRLGALGLPGGLAPSVRLVAFAGSLLRDL